jgi:heptosyltransferase-2
VIANPIPHGRFDLGAATSRVLRGDGGREGYAEARCAEFVVRAVPWLARIPRRVGYVGESRWGPLPTRPLARKAAAARRPLRRPRLSLDAPLPCAAAGARARSRQSRRGTKALA